MSQNPSRLQDTWGISPEIEFFLIHAIRIEIEHGASPWNALKGLGGREIEQGSWIGPDGTVLPDGPETKASVVLFPDERAEDWLDTQWKQEQQIPRLAVITADDQQYKRLAQRLGPAKLILQVTEGKASQGTSEVLFTEREVEGGSLPEKGAVLIWQS